MGRCFNSTGACDPKLHYMVDIQSRLAEIKKLVDDGKYFAINRARQYGKTTTLNALSVYLSDAYIVIPLDFQMLGSSDFENERAFSNAFADIFLAVTSGLEELENSSAAPYMAELKEASEEESISGLRKLFRILTRICGASPKPIVLIIDEVDSASNNQVFLDFLAQLRGYYLARNKFSTFQSVILAGLYDVKNIKLKIRTESEHKVNSPWNIAADFDISMSLSKEGIVGMLSDYENDHNTGMNIEEISSLIYDYTSGYPFLVSRLCKLIDEKVAGCEEFPDKAQAWTKNGFLEAVKILVSEKNALFESLIGKLENNPVLNKKIYSILFSGKQFMFSSDDPALDMARMFGFVKNTGSTVSISNRIFETRIYNYFLSKYEVSESEISDLASGSKNQFIVNGYLDMELVLKKFVEHFDSIYGDLAETFDEDEGRRRFLLYLRPIINGTGNYYIEARTRNDRRMDVVTDYKGRQYIVELKIWRGNAYNERGEQQLSDYLDYFKLKKGYMLSYNFNKKKEIGIKHINIGERILVEAVV